LLEEEKNRFFPKIAIFSSFDLKLIPNASHQLKGRRRSVGAATFFFFQKVVMGERTTTRQFFQLLLFSQSWKLIHWKCSLI
jgi:hypothetical protein